MSEKQSSLEQIILNAKRVNEFESAVEIIKKVVESPLIYSFSEILEIPFFASVLFLIKFY